MQGARLIPKALVCGFVLRALRERAGIGLEDFARLANVNRPSMSKLETGRTMLAVDRVEDGGEAPLCRDWRDWEVGVIASKNVQA